MTPIFTFSKALRIAEVESTPFNGFGEVVSDKEGKATGVLKESAQSLVSRHVPKPSRGAKEIELYGVVYKKD